MNSHVPQVKTSLECPEHKKNCDVTVEVNVFRGAIQGGLEIIDCSEFAHDHEGIPCAQGCIHAPEAQSVHDQAVRKHQQDLSTIGPNVMG